MATYPMHVAGLDRDFPICKVTDDLYIGAFIMFGDAELTVRCAEELLKLAEGIDYDYLFTAEAKSIPLIHEMARQSGAKKYFIARKGPKVYMPDPISVEDKSITTVAQQKLFLGSDDADLIRGKEDPARRRCHLHGWLAQGDGSTRRKGGRHRYGPHGRSRRGRRSRPQGHPVP